MMVIDRTTGSGKAAHEVLTDPRLHSRHSSAAAGAAQATNHGKPSCPPPSAAAPCSAQPLERLCPRQKAGSHAAKRAGPRSVATAAWARDLAEHHFSLMPLAIRSTSSVVKLPLT